MVLNLIISGITPRHSECDFSSHKNLKPRDFLTICCLSYAELKELLIEHFKKVRKVLKRF